MIEKGLHLFWVTRYGCWPDGLVRFLRIRGFGFVNPRRIRHIARAKSVTDITSDSGNGLIAKLNTICPHIGNQAGCLATYIDAFIEFLRNLHCPAGSKPQLA